MDMKDVIKELNNLIQLDIDAIGAYEQAIDNVAELDVKSELTAFKADHTRHVSELSAEVRRLGGQPTERKKDVKGFLIQGFTAIRSATGTEGALKAMQSNEKLTNKNYGNAVQMNFPVDVMQVVERGFRDEQRHLAWIESALQRRVWEGAPTQP